MRPTENEEGLWGVARFFVCSDGELPFLGSSSVSERVTGAMPDRGGAELLEISGVDCAYGVASAKCPEGGSGGIAVMAPADIFQSRLKSGDMRGSFGLKSNGSCSESMVLVTGVPL